MILIEMIKSILLLVLNVFIAKSEPYKCPENSKHRPNIIFVLSDDMGWNDIGYHSDQIQTPNLDTLASDGIRFERYYTQPLCTQSRGAALTGHYPIRSGTQNVVQTGSSPWGLPLNQKILPQYLKDLGYATHAIGKWHLGFYRKEYLPNYRGFDTHYGFWNGAQDYYSHSYQEGDKIGLDFRDNLNVVFNESGNYATPLFTDRALQIISNHDKCEPLFLYLAFPNVHAGNDMQPLQAPQRFVDKFDYIPDRERRVFAANAYALDISVGKIFERLFDEDLLENSIFFFASDNGAAFSGFSENRGSNYPLRGTKGTLWEGGVRVPSFAWSPLFTNSGHVSNSLIHVTDITPTFLEAADSVYYEKIKDELDGISIWKLLNKGVGEPKREEILLNIDPIYDMSAIIGNKIWKLVQGRVPTYKSLNSYAFSPSYALEEESENEVLKRLKKLKLYRINSVIRTVLEKMHRHPNYDNIEDKPIYCGDRNQKEANICDETKSLCLFDIESDPCEYNNLAQEFPEKVKELWNKIIKYNSTAVPPLSLTRIDPYSNPFYHNGIWDIYVH